METGSSPFEVFGLKPSFEIDGKQLESRYIELSKQLHPDRHATAAAAVRLKSLEESAALNQAYSQIKSSEARLETLLALAGLGGSSEKNNTPSRIPTDLTEEYFEIQEEPTPEAVHAFQIKLLEKQTKLTQNMHDLARTTHWADLGDADRNTVARIAELRQERSYLRSMLDNLEKLPIERLEK